MCECRSNIEAKLMEKFKEQVPGDRNHSARLQGYTFILGESIQEKGCMSIEFMSIQPLKKGGEKLKVLKQSMIFTYCPFCGVKYHG